MSSSTVRYQVLLSRPELAYLLAVISARPVIGLDNAQVAASHGDEGFEQLVANGRLVADSSGWNLDNRLARMIATMAAPERTMMVTRTSYRTGDQQRQQQRPGEQVVTYYAAGDLLVEQYRTDDPRHWNEDLADRRPEDRYLIATVTDADHMVERIIGAIPALVNDGPEQGTAEPTVAIPIDRFGPAVAANPPTRRRALLLECLLAAGVSRQRASAWAEAVAPEGATVVIEAAALAGPRPVARRDLHHFPGPAPVMVADGVDGGSVMVGPGDRQTIGRQLLLIWDGLSDDRRRFTRARVGR